MKIAYIKSLQVIALNFLLLLVLNSCKKTLNQPEEILNADAERAKIIEAIRERYGNITAPIIMPVNKRAAAISYTDNNGVSHRIGSDIQTDATCGQYDCSTAPSASDLYVNYTLLYAKWYYTCGTGHDLTATWRISVPYTLLLQDPNSSDYSFGNIRIRNGGTVLATSGDLGNGNLEIINLGTDPGCSSNTVYTVTYTWQNISETYFPGNAVDASLTIYNDCVKTNYINIVTWVNGPPYSTSFEDVFSHPCNRTDQAFVVIGGSPYAQIAGAYIICSPPSGFIGTTEHQVEYRPVTNPSSDLWNDQPNSGMTISPIYFGIIPGTGTPGTPSQTMDACCDVLNLSNMTASSGKWIVRYRNIYGTTYCNFISGTPPVIWSGVWHEEMWNL